MSLSVIIAGSASYDVLAAVAGKRIIVTSFVLTGADVVGAQFQSGGSTNLTGNMVLDASMSIASPFVHDGLFETAVGEKLNIVIGAAISVAGYLTYRLIN